MFTLGNKFERKHARQYEIDMPNAKPNVNLANTTILVPTARVGIHVWSVGVCVEYRLKTTSIGTVKYSIVSYSRVWEQHLFIFMELGSCPKGKLKRMTLTPLTPALPPYIRSCMKIEVIWERSR